MTSTNRTTAATTTHTTTRGRRICAEILDSLSDDALEALERWRRLVDLDFTHLGGRGRTREQTSIRPCRCLRRGHLSVAVRAWDELPLAAQDAYFSVLVAVVFELVDAIRHVGVPEIERPIYFHALAEEVRNAIEALLGSDHPALRVLPAYALVDAYEEAIYQAGGLND